MSSKVVKVWTDGAYDRPTQTGGWAAVMELPCGNIREASGRVRETGSNRVELIAIISALDNLEPESRVLLHTDSQSVWFMMKNYGRRTCRDSDLWGSLVRALDRHDRVNVTWIRSDVGIPQNERADKLAQAACGVVRDIEFFRATYPRRPPRARPMSPGRCA